MTDNTYFLTFREWFAWEEHPVLGMCPELPTGWVEVVARDLDEAAYLARRYGGCLSAEIDETAYLSGCLGRIDG